MKFCEEVDAAFGRLNPLTCVYHDAEDVFFVGEKQAEGFAKIEIRSRYPCFHVQNMDKHVFPVLQERRCADALVFQFDPETRSWRLHIFELTKSISISKWGSKIVPQFNGALLNAYAILGVLQCGAFAEVVVHCGYRKNASENSTVDLRAMLGAPAPKDWLNGPVHLPSFPAICVQHIPIRLDEENGCGRLRL